MSIKNSNDTIGNRIRDLRACSAVPQTTAPFRVPIVVAVMFYSAVDSLRTSNTIAHKQCGGHISCLYCITNRLMGTAWYINLVVMKE